jgi:hypothetical protein
MNHLIELTIQQCYCKTHSYVNTLHILFFLNVLSFSLGWASESVAFRVGDGSLFVGRPWGQPGYGPKCDIGDKIGIGIRPSTKDPDGNRRGNVTYVYFTHNGKEFGSSAVNCKCFAAIN